MWGLALPAYVCYNKDLCENQLLLPLMQYTTIDLFGNNSTCVTTKNLQDQYKFYDWSDMINTMYLLFGKCSMPHQPSLMANLSNLYKCTNSSRMISQHRLKDNVEDCLFGDDESYTESCSLNNTQHRFKCIDKNKNIVCLSHVLVGDFFNDCANKSDENNLNGQHYSETRISFQTMCDGFTELLPILINGSNETDETECSYFPCNNSYTRCDGIWNCLNGADEVNCEWPPLCPSFHHMCVSRLTNNLTCLSIEYVNNGNIDCVGSSDERQFCREKESHTQLAYRCENTDECTSSLDACNTWFDFCSHNINPQFCNITNFRSDRCLPGRKNLTHVDQLFCFLNDFEKQTTLHLSLTINTSSEWATEMSKSNIFLISHSYRNFLIYFVLYVRK